MGDETRIVRPFKQSKKNIARLQQKVRELAQDSTQVRTTFEGLGQGKWEDVSDYDVTRMLRRCFLKSSLDRKSEGEWIVKATGMVHGMQITATVAIQHDMFLIVTEVERD